MSAPTRLRHDLLATVEKLGLPSYVLDRDCIIRRLNPAGRELFREVTGKHVTTLRTSI